MEDGPRAHEQGEGGEDRAGEERKGECTELVTVCVSTAARVLVGEMR